MLCLAPCDPVDCVGQNVSRGTRKDISFDEEGNDRRCSDTAKVARLNQIPQICLKKTWLINGVNIFCRFYFVFHVTLSE